MGLNRSQFVKDRKYLSGMRQNKRATHEICVLLKGMRRMDATQVTHSSFFKAMWRNKLASHVTYSSFFKCRRSLAFIFYFVAGSTTITQATELSPFILQTIAVTSSITRFTISRLTMFPTSIYTKLNKNKF